MTVPPIGDPTAGRLVPVGDTRLWVLEMGDGLPVLLLHGGPGLDHTQFRPWLDPLAARFRLVFVDMRGQGRSEPVDPATLDLAALVRDVDLLAEGLGLDRFAVLGQSFGSFVALQHAVDWGTASHYVLAGCVPSSTWLRRVEQELRRIEPPALRERIAGSWERETEVRTEEEFRQLLDDQLPFHFAETGPAYRAFGENLRHMRFAPNVLRRFAREDYGAIHVEDRLGSIRTPVLVVAGDHDRVCAPEGGYAIAEAAPAGDYVVLPNAGHMMFAEAPAAFRRAVMDFLERTGG